MPHIHEKIDFVAEVFIVHKNKVLIRKHDKYDIWLAPGGHVELDEDPNQAAVREAKEEVGLDIELVGQAGSRKGYVIFEGARQRELIPPRFMNIHDINVVHQHISHVYFATSESDEVVDEGREQSKGYKWFTKEDLEKNEDGLSELIRHYAMTALEEVGEDLD